MSIFARMDKSLMAIDEPTESSAYILSALAACEQGQKALNTRGKERKVWDVRVSILHALLTWSLI